MTRKQTAIIILNGFLGSGKTTILQSLIQKEQALGHKVGVVMNELGETSIDSFSIPEGTPMKEMANGCVCCTLQGELSKQLETLVEEYTLDVIFIETTGAAHPVDVMDACTHPLLTSNLWIKAVITVVNAIQWYEQKMSIKLKKLLKAQVQYADVIIINKTDLVHEEQHHSVFESLKATNPNAVLLSRSEQELSTLETLLSRTRRLNEPLEKAHVHDQLHIHTFTVKLPYPLEKQSFLDFIQSLGPNIFRVKGFVQLEGQHDVFLFNYSYESALFEKWPSYCDPVLVFIGENMDKDDILSSLEKLKVERKKLQ
ncbi:CobW family GTP-binding protein [Alkalihalobacterium bogoriense]|uniref:CobW family GTP-binding protein n=1 Tax=Alkalihalobacterium bogoriense TaxID=246272 RepID=UPI00055831C4|nr:GTP-binding protein [Alkalihalobacterium bogoriense]